MKGHIKATHLPPQALGFSLYILQYLVFDFKMKLLETKDSIRISICFQFISSKEKLKIWVNPQCNLWAQTRTTTCNPAGQIKGTINIIMVTDPQCWD